MDVERLAADLRREDVPARLIRRLTRPCRTWPKRGSPGETVPGHVVGRLRRPHDKLLRGWATR